MGCAPRQSVVKTARTGSWQTVLGIAPLSHFGQTNTSILGQLPHLELKATILFLKRKHLKHINNDLLTIMSSIQKIDTMLDNQVTEINALIWKETMQITHRHSNPMIAALTRKMSQHALDLFMVEFKAAKNVENSIYECNFSTKYGNPCRHHTIYDKMESSGTFQSADFHEHWMLQHEISSPAANVSSPQQKRLNSIQETLYSVDADQVPVLLQSLEEATSRPLHMLCYQSSGQCS